MTALLDKPEAPAVHNILLTIAQEYPEVRSQPFYVIVLIYLLLFNVVVYFNIIVWCM